VIGLLLICFGFFLASPDSVMPAASPSGHSYSYFDSL